MNMQQLKSIKLTKKGAKIVYPKTFAPKKNEMKISGDYVCNGKYKPHSDLTDILDGLAAFIYKFVSGDKAYFDEANVVGVKVIENKYDESISIVLDCKLNLIDDERVFEFSTPQLQVDKLSKKDREAIQSLLDSLVTECMLYVTKQKRDFVQMEIDYSGKDKGEGNGEEESEQAEAA